MEELFSAAAARAVRPLPTLIARCEHCGLHKNCQSKKMRPDGGNLRKVMILSEYPGTEEDAQGAPLVGPSGRWLAGEFRELGWDMRRDCVIHNAIACHAKKANEHKSAVSDCRPNVLRAIREHDPRVILLMGGAAIRSVIGHLWREDVGAAGRWVGYQIPCHKPNAWVCPTYNPAHVLRTLKERDAVTVMYFRHHLKTALELASRPHPDGPPDYQSRCEAVYDPADAAARIRKITGGIVAFDFETNCLKSQAPTSEIVCCSFCDGDVSFTFPWHGDAKEAARELFANRDVGKIAHNIQFETSWCANVAKVEVRGWRWCTMTNAHLLDPRRGVSGLKFQAFARLGCPDYSSHLDSMLDSGKGTGGYATNQVRKIEPRVLYKYCALDSLLEYELARLQMRELNYVAL